MNTTFKTDIIGYGLFAALILFVVPWAFSFDGFELNTFARYLTLGMVAMALALSWGYAGVLNLGQAATFGLGSYVMAMHLKLRASASSYNGMPDFMGWTNVEVLPWFWEPFHSLTFTLVAGLALPALVAWLMAVFMFRGRVTGVFVAIITLAFLVALQLVFISEQRYTGGQNGLTGLAPLELFGWRADAYSTSFYYIVAGCLITALALGLAVVRSKVGLILRAIREDANRVRFFGYDVARYETLAFCVSAALTGWAGMLYVLVLEFASPTYMSVPFSLGIVIWCAVGGRESLVAAALGAVVVNMLEGRLSSIFVEGWFLFLGILFIVVVLVMPRGLYGLFSDAVQRLQTVSPRDRGGKVATKATPLSATPAVKEEN